MKIYFLKKAYFALFPILLCCLTLSPFFASLHAQDRSVSTVGWLYLQNEHQFNDRWELHTDVHLRSTDDFSNFGNLLVRNWIGFNVSDDWSAGIGYAFLGSWNDDVAMPDTYYGEHRSFQQIQHKIKNTNTSTVKHRARFEQRFFDTALLPALSLRARYALNWKRTLPNRPLGMDYFFLENEVFINTKGRDLSGGRVFEQNRAYGGLGYPLIGSSALELGAYYEIQHDVFKQTNRSVIFQLLIKTTI